MPIQAFPVAGLPLIKAPEYTPDYSYISEFLPRIMRGYKLGGMPEELERAKEKEESMNRQRGLRNRLLSEELQHAPTYYKNRAEMAGYQNLINSLKANILGETGLDQARADVRYKNALAQHAGDFSGALGQVQGLDRIKNQFGEDSEQYKTAKRAVEAEIGGKEALAASRTALTKTAAYRSASPLAKLNLERAKIEEGFDPYSDRVLTTEEQNMMLNQNRLVTEKTISDTGTRQKVHYATNIDKTLERINPEVLMQYSGIPGQIRKKIEEGKALSGEAEKSFIEYEKAMTSVKVLAKQVRQFYGDSIQEGARKDIEYITNPSNWHTSPKVAIAKFNSLKELLLAETQTYKDAVNAGKMRPREHTGKEPDPLGLL